MVVRLHDVYPILASQLVVPLIMMAISIGISYLAMALTPKPKASNQFDKQPPMLSMRGAWIGLLQGRYRVGCVIAWVGDRTSKTKSSGGKGAGSAGGAPSKTYYESSWHQICIGPVNALYQIRQNESVIYGNTASGTTTTPYITSTDTPSGSTCTCKDGSKFRIYWGEDDQPVDTYLASKLSFTALDTTTQQLSSRWPGLCYVVWDRKQLGTSPTWPQIDYIIEAIPTISTLSGTDVKIDKTSAVWDDEGINAIQALYSLLRAPFPHGCGLTDTRFDVPSWEAAAVVAASERLMMNVYIEAGNQASDEVTRVCKVCDLMVPQVKNAITAVMIRPESSTFTVTPDAQVDPDPEIDRLRGTFGTDRPVFSFLDNHLAYKNHTLTFRRDWMARGNNRTQVVEETLDYVTDRVTAQRVAARKYPQYTLQTQTVKFTATRDVSDPSFHAGVVFTVPSIGQLRLTAKTKDPNTPTYMVESVFDAYSFGVSATLPVLSEDGGPSIVTTVAADLAFLPVYVPKEWSGRDSPNFIVPRIRANGLVIMANVFLSTDESGPYFRIGAQDAYGTGGVLIDSMLGTADDVATGPTFTVLGDDIDEALDLTGNDPAWLDGQQLLVVESEVMLCRSVTAMGGSTFRFDGIRRAQMGTAATSHAAGIPAILFKKGDMSLEPAPVSRPGDTEWVKTLPSDGVDSIELTSVTPMPLGIPVPWYLVQIVGADANLDKTYVMVWRPTTSEWLGTRSHGSFAVDVTTVGSGSSAVWHMEVIDDTGPGTQATYEAPRGDVTDISLPDTVGWHLVSYTTSSMPQMTCTLQRTPSPFGSSEPPDASVPSGTPLITTGGSGTLRSDIGAGVGLKLVTNTTITVGSLGRWVVSGNSGTHTVAIYATYGSSPLASVSVDTTTGSAGSYEYTDLVTPLTLSAGTYYLMSVESNGGDQWYDQAAASISTDPRITSIAGSYDDGTAFTAGTAGETYGPINLKFV